MNTKHTPGPWQSRTDELEHLRKTNIQLLEINAGLWRALERSLGEGAVWAEVSAWGAEREAAKAAERDNQNRRLTRMAWKLIKEQKNETD